jgi:hypothetical protein
MSYRYTNGEVRALVAPVMQAAAEDMGALVIVAVRQDGDTDIWSDLPTGALQCAVLAKGIQTVACGDAAPEASDS